MEEYPQGEKDTWMSQVTFLINEANCGKETALYALLQWLKDMNWPGAKEACDYLAINCEKVLPRIKEVLGGSDYLWKYWVINSLIARMPREMVIKMTPELVELARNNDNEAVNLSSVRILCKEKLCSKNELLEVVERIENFNPNLSEEINEIKSLIG